MNTSVGQLMLDVLEINAGKKDKSGLDMFRGVAVRKEAQRGVRKI